jgi:peroxiredoxin (alkyl hydroperoxide reductase subunit C)
MRTIVFWILLLPFCSLRAENSVLVGKSAPNFCTKAVIKDQIVDGYSLESLRGSYVILYFYPLDFTFVCPTELHAFQERLQEFEARNTKVIACSVDSEFSHLAWLKIPRSMGGIQGVTYPILSDLNRSIAESYQVLNPDGVAYRGLYLIDRSGTIRHQLVNDLSLGRNVDEALRILDALITHEQVGEVCPANWQKGKPTFKPTSEGLIDYYSNQLEN